MHCIVKDILIYYKVYKHESTVTLWSLPIVILATSQPSYISCVISVNRGWRTTLSSPPPTIIILSQ
eukprot:m.49150 g.49150  ORF g.49150 m.49150 type:complete len:66 (+) comp7437_c0_seq1:111-308(+)